MSFGFDGRGRRPGRDYEAQPQLRERTRQDLELEEQQGRDAAELREAMDRQVAEFRSRKEAIYFLHRLHRKAPASPAEVRAAEEAMRRRFGPCEGLLKIAARDELPAAWEQHPPTSPSELLDLARTAILADVLAFGLDCEVTGPVLSGFLDACDPATVRAALAQLKKEGRLDELDERTQGAARKRKGAAGQVGATSQHPVSDPYRALIERAALTDSRIAAEKALAHPDYDPDLRENHEQEVATLHGQAAGGVLPLPSELLSMRPSELVFRLSLVEPAIKRYPPADVVRGFESLRLARGSREIDSVLAALGVSELGLGWMLWFRTGHATSGKILSLGALQLGRLLGWPSRLDQMTEAARAERGARGEHTSAAAHEVRGGPRTEPHAHHAHPGEHHAPADAIAIAPPEPGINRPGFIDNDDGANIRTGPAELGGTVLTAEPLPATTRVFVSGEHKEAPEWWYASAFLPSAIVRGYVQHFRINTDLPEPSAKLHQIKSGDTVERLAVEEFAAAVRDGHDLRYYENVLLAVNRDKRRAGIKGTFQDPNLFGGSSNNIQLEAGRRIWLVSPAYAKAMEGLVPSGSLTGGAYAKAGRVLGHLEDILASVTDSPKHFGAVAGEYAEAIKEHLPEIIGITAGFILAESASAFLAATPTGVGQLAAVVIQLGLAAFGAKAALDAGIQALEHGQKWLILAWTAQGDRRKLQEASQEFLKMLVSVALAALAATGMKSNLGKGIKIADAIKIQPPRLGWSPAMVTPEGVEIGGGPVFMPGSIASTGPVVIKPGVMTGAGYLGNMMAAGKGAGGSADEDTLIPGKRGEDENLAELLGEGPEAGAVKPARNMRNAGIVKMPPEEGKIISGQAAPKPVRNAHLAGKRHPLTGIPFDMDGYPDFRAAGVVQKEVKIVSTGSRSGDFAAANRAAGLKETPKGMTWHHHQDGTTMQLVPTDAHAKTGHSGGFSL